MLQIAFEHLEKPARLRPMGRWMMRIGGLFVPEARETLEMMYQFERPFTVDSSKYFAAFGKRYTAPEEGMVRTVDWYGARRENDDK